MNLEEIYFKNKKKLLFSGDSNVSEIRNNILEKLLSKKNDSKNKKKYNNDDFNIFDKINYKFENSSISSSIRVYEKRIYNFDIVDGHLKPFEDSQIKISPIEYKDNNILDEDNDIINLNTLFTNGGYEIEIKKSKKITINIKNIISNSSFTTFQKNSIICNQNSEVTIIETFEDKSSDLNNIFQSIELKQNAKLNHIIIQKINENNNLFLNTHTICNYYSNYNQTVFNFSEGKVINCHYTDLNESQSNVNYNGLFFLKDFNNTTNKTLVRHNSESCKSDQNYKGVLGGNSKATYNSFTIVGEKAPKTEGFQLSKGILLSKDSIFLSKPELRIYNEDVKCSHGATIGPVDEKIIYYIRSRGISKTEAINILVRSFVEENILRLNNINIKNKIDTYINNFLTQLN